MIVKILISILIIFSSCALSSNAQTQADYDKNIIFSVFVKDTNLNFTSTFNDTLLATNCLSRIYLIIHGWNEKISTWWVRPLVNNYLTYGTNGSCVVFMDYGAYSIVADYFVLVGRYQMILNTLIKKMWQIKRYGDVEVFGFSFGSRLAQGMGYNLTMANGGVPQVAKMNLCDPAGPGFEGTIKIIKNPKLSSKNTACINTSTDKGTRIYDCQQNFLLGNCGITQPAATSPPMMSHGLCPYFFINSFFINFTSNNLNKCTSTRLISNTTAVGAKLGFFNTNFFDGVMFIATAKCYPFLVVNNVINNYPVNKTSCPPYVF